MLRSLDAGATIVAIGPFTNLAALEELQPGILAGANIVMMGTTVLLPAVDLPQWGPAMDYNVQQDVAAAMTILSSSAPLLVSVGISMRATIRRSHLAGLRRGGTLATLVARQAEAFDAEWHNAERYGSMRGVRHDMIDFLYDPVACAIATGWRAGVHIETLPVVWEICGDHLVQRVEDGGKPLPVVVDLGGAALEEEWLRRVSESSIGPGTA